MFMGVRDAAHLAQALSAAKASFPDAPVVMVGDARNRDLVVTALAEGATTFIDENVATSTLIKELELVAMGEPVVSVLLMKRLLGEGSAQALRALEQDVAPIKLDQRQQPEPENEARSNPQLSEREAAILKGLIHGNPNKVIAYQLQITEATVKVHVKAILRKIRVRNRTQAAIWALERRGAPKRLTEFQQEGLLRFGADLGDQLARRGAACEAKEWVPSRALSAKNDGSWPRQPTLGYDKVDSLMIEHGTGEGSRRSAARY